MQNVEKLKKDWYDVHARWHHFIKCLCYSDQYILVVVAVVVMTERNSVYYDPSHRTVTLHSSALIPAASCYRLNAMLVAQSSRSNRPTTSRSVGALGESLRRSIAVRLCAGCVLDSSLPFAALSSGLQAASPQCRSVSVQQNETTQMYPRTLTLIINQNWFQEVIIIMHDANRCGSILVTSVQNWLKFSPIEWWPRAKSFSPILASLNPRHPIQCRDAAVFAKENGGVPLGRSR